jgi:SAM-dependent methyltransferase
MYPDDTFDLSITNQGIMFVSDPDKALAQIYRTTKPGGVCYITSWNQLGHKIIAMKVIKRLRGENGRWDTPPNFWKEEWNDPAHLTSKLEQFGFKECAAEIKLEYINYPAPEGFSFAVENLPKLYANWITLKEGEEEPWGKIWEEELLPYNTSEGVKIPMWANIARGKK